jgi:hypothetical protein
MEEPGKAGREALDSLHGRVAQEIKNLMDQEHMGLKVKGIELALKFLKDNNVTENSIIPVRVQDVRASLPSVEELEIMERSLPGSM